MNQADIEKYAFLVFLVERRTEIFYLKIEKLHLRIWSGLVI